MNPSCQVSIPGWISILCVSVCICVGSSFAQTFREVTDGQWGPGIDEACPLLVDLDKDGVTELMVGSVNGRAMLFRRFATLPLELQRVWGYDDSLDVESQLAPAAADLDKDGRLDFLMGSNSGYIQHFRQKTSTSMVLERVTFQFSAINDGARAIPCLTDLNQDGRYELLIGTSGGEVTTWTQSPTDPFVFTKITPSVITDRIDVYASLAVGDLDADGKLDLLATCASGDVFHFEQPTAKALSFTFVERNFLGITGVGLGGLTIGDVDRDGNLDILIGDRLGNVRYYRNTNPASYQFSLVKFNILPIQDFGYRSTLLVTDLEPNGLTDLLVSHPESQADDTDSAWVRLLEQVSAAEPTRFALMLPNFNGISVTDYSRMAITDFEGDGQKDLVVAHERGAAKWYRQHPTDRRLFSLKSPVFNAPLFSSSVYAFFSFFTDLDKDGKLDWIGGRSSGAVLHHVQASAKDTTFIPSPTPLSLSTFNVYYPSPTIGDLDNDGLLDMLVGTYRAIQHYEQDAADPRKFTLITSNFPGLPKPNYYTSLQFARLRGAQAPLDIFMADNMGGIRLFLRESSTSSNLPQQPQDFQVGAPTPHPATLWTRIAVDLPFSGEVGLTVSDLLGRTMLVQAPRLLNAGRNWLSIDTRGLPSGFYLVSVEMGQQRSTLRLAVAH